MYRTRLKITIHLCQTRQSNKNHADAYLQTGLVLMKYDKRISVSRQMHICFWGPTDIRYCIVPFRTVVVITEQSPTSCLCQIVGGQYDRLRCHAAMNFSLIAGDHIIQTSFSGAKRWLSRRSKYI